MSAAAPFASSLEAQRSGCADGSSGLLGWQILGNGVTGFAASGGDARSHVYGPLPNRSVDKRSSWFKERERLAPAVAVDTDGDECCKGSDRSILQPQVRGRRLHRQLRGLK